MSDLRPELKRGLSAASFLNYYYLKEELTAFCRANSIPVSGGKAELTQRITQFLDTGTISSARATKIRTVVRVDEITKDSVIEQNIVCSQVHRRFFRKHIGDSFKFNVTFQNWLKNNAGKTYGDAISAWYSVRMEKNVLGPQFEYNAYIRDFFTDEPRGTMEEAIRCWKYKRSIPGENRFERSDRQAVSAQLLNEREPED